jgi:quercetin dioxygenase-like cupin family protein
MVESARKPAPTAQTFVAGKSVTAERVTHIEGAPEAGDIAIKPLITGADMLFMEVRRAKGLVDPLHSHPDHESICYLVSGRLRVEIAGESFDAGPGDSWIHAPGVLHRHEALEDCIQIEAKSPPRKTWR